MSDTYYDPASGMPLTIPDSPGDFSETVPRKQPIQYDENGLPIPQEEKPYAPMSPGQESDERARLNASASARGTVTGSASASARKFETELPVPGEDVPPEVTAFAHGKPFVYNGKAYAPPEVKEAAQDSLEDIQANIVAYSLMRPYKGFTEGVKSLGGQIAGAATSPENLILPELKIGTAAWYANNPVMGTILSQGFGQAVTQGVADAITQVNEVRASLRKEYSPAQTLVAIPIGGILGAGFPAAYFAGSRIFKDIMSSLRGEAPLIAPELRPTIPAEPPSIKPDPGFEQGGGPLQPKAIVGADGTPTGQTRPEPLVSEGNVRLYHQDTPGSVTKDTETFTLHPEEGSTSFIDMPQEAVAPMRNGEKVSLPKSLADQRQPLPSISPPESAGERVAAEQRASDIVSELKDIGPDAAGFAEGIKRSLASGVFRPESLPFYEERLASFRAQAGSVADKPQEAITLTDYLDKKHQKTLADTSSFPTEIRNALADAHTSFTDAVAKVNEGGLKLGEVNSFNVKGKPEVEDAQKQASQLGGQVSRLLNGIKHTKGDFSSPRVVKDLANLRELIAEGKRPYAVKAADAKEAAKITGEAGPEAGKSFTEFVRKQGGLKPSPEVDAIYGRKRPDIIRTDGKTLDQMREAAVEAKYFRDHGIESGGPPSTTTRDVLDRLADEDKGVLHYAEGEGAPRKADARMQQIESDVYAHMQEDDLLHEPTDAENRAVFRDTANRMYRTEGLSVEDALERAMQAEGAAKRAAKFQPEESNVIPFEMRQKGLVGTSAAPAPGSHRPAAGIPGAPDKPGAAQAANVKGAMESIARALNIEVRTGVNKPGAVGTLQGKLMRLTELGVDGYITFGHEIAHDVEATVGKDMSNLIQTHALSMKNFAGPEATGEPAQIAREGFGEFLALYMSERDLAKLKDQNFVREFRDLMEQKAPALLEQIDRGHLAYAAYQAAPSARVVTSMITSLHTVKASKAADPLKRAAVFKWFDSFYKYFVNIQDPLNNAVNSILRSYKNRTGVLHDLTPENNPSVVFQVLRNGTHSMSLQEMTAGILDSNFQHVGTAPVSIMQRVTADPITGAAAPDLATVARRNRDFAGYLISHRHQELREQMLRGESDLTRPPTNMTDGDAAQTIAEMEKAYPNFRALAEEAWAYRAALRRKEFDAGLLTPEEYQETLKSTRYVPLNRDMTEVTGEGVGGGSGRRARGLEDVDRKRLEGSGRNIISPMEAMMDRHFRLNEEINYNKALRVYRDFMRNVGGAEAAKFGEEVPNFKMRVQDIDVRRVIEQGLKDQGFNTVDARDIATSHLMELSMDSKVRMFQKEKLTGGGETLLFAGWTVANCYAIKLPDTEYGRENLFRAVDFLGSMGTQSVGQAAGLLHDIMVKPAKLLRFGAVTTFTFAVKNMFRDGFGSFAYINGIKAPMEALVRGAWELAREAYAKGGSDTVRRYRAMGGLEGGSASAAFSREGRSDVTGQALYGGHRFDVAAEERRLDRAAHGVTVSGTQLALEALSDARKLFTEGLRKVTKFAEAGETANRIGIFKVVYEQNKKLGRSEEFAMMDAGQKARDFTDFGRHGSGTELITQTIPFLGASIQGTDKFVRTIAQVTGLKRPLTQFEQASVNDMRKQLAWKLSSLAAVGVFLEYLYQDDTWYQSLPLQTRATNWNFKVHGVHVKIPKPFEWATLLNLAENAYRYTNTGDEQHIFNWMKSLAYTHNLPSNFPLISTWLGLAANYDQYFDRPIVPGRQQHLLPHLQRLNDTSQFYISLANMLNDNVWNSQDAHAKLQYLGPVGAILASAWAPVESQWVVSRMLGDWPRELGGMDGIAKSITTGDNIKISDMPVLRSLIQEKMIMGEPIREIINQTNQHDGKLVRAKASYDYFLKQGDDLGAQHVFDQMDASQKEFVRLGMIDGGKTVNTMHPMERAKAIYTAVSTILGQMDLPTGIRSFVDPKVQVPLADNMKIPVANLLTEFAANQARNTLIAQNAPGYKGQTMVPTQPDLEKLKAMAPEVHKELVSQLADARVLPWDTVEKYWPQVQRLLAGGGNRRVLSIQAKALGMAAAAEGGLEGGGIALRKGSLAEGSIIKRGGIKPDEIPATEGALP